MARMIGARLCAWLASPIRPHGIRVPLRFSDVGLVVLAFVILSGGLLFSSTREAQSRTTVVNTWVVTTTSIRSSTITTATTSTGYTTQTSTLTIVSTETFTSAYFMFGSTSNAFYTSFETIQSTSRYTSILSTQLPLYYSSANTITQYLSQTISLAGFSPGFLATLVAPILISIIVFGGAYVRVNTYRTRLHIYHEILQYVAESPKIPSHIMRRCNLETRKFSKYISTLGERGFVEKIQGDGERYRVTDKALSYLKDEKLFAFIKELP